MVLHTLYANHWRKYNLPCYITTLGRFTIFMVSIGLVQNCKPETYEPSLKSEVNGTQSDRIIREHCLKWKFQDEEGFY